MSPTTIRNMTDSDLDFASELTASENWLTESRQSFENFLAHDPHGCFIAQSGDLRIGMCVGVAYEGFGFLAELIVVKACRGRGVGSALISHTVKYLKQRGAAGVYLHGDVEAVPLYESLGFKKICRSLSFTGEPDEIRSTGTRPMNVDDLDAVIAMDKAVFGGDRSVFLCRNNKAYPHLCRVQGDGNNITGYIFGREGNGIIAVGPCGVRDGANHLRSLFSGLCYSTQGDRTQGTRVRIDILESHQEALETMRSISFMKETGFTWRMVLGEDKTRGYPERACAVGSPATG